MEEEYIPVILVQDESSHWYCIPLEMDDEFFNMSEECANNDYDHNSIAKFTEKFGKYMTGGGVNNYQLCMAKSEFNKLTGE